MVQWARHLLVNAGEMHRGPRGLWRITERGRTRIKGLAPPIIEPDHDQIASWLKEILEVSYTFEVQDRGNLNEALVKLQHTYDRWKPYLFVIITGERDWKRAERLLNLSLAGAFHRLRGKLRLLSPRDVKNIFDNFQRCKDIIRLLVKER